MRVMLSNGSNDVKRDETKTREKESRWRKEDRGRLIVDDEVDGRREEGESVKMAFSFPRGGGWRRRESHYRANFENQFDPPVI